MPSKKYKNFKLETDNHTKDFGDTDFNKHLIRINKKINKKKGSQGELINTIVHEFDHVKHPKMKEKNIQKLALKNVNHMSTKSKDKDYKLFSKPMAKAKAKKAAPKKVMTKKKKK